MGVELYRRLGRLLVPVAMGREPRAGRPERIEWGSYRLTARLGERCLRYPVRIERGKRHRLRLRLPPDGALPPGMIAVPAGPYLAREAAGGPPVEWRLGDFAIGELPVTLRQYAAWLDELDPDEQLRRTPLARDGEPVLQRGSAGQFVVYPKCVEGAARKYLQASTPLQLPCYGLRWHDALAYACWLAEQTGLPYRLPAAAEWEKAMRGADGRLFPMGNALDPSFAKLRQSRPEAAQPEPVGAFPLDVSPYGVRDLAGGVCDWTDTFVDGGTPPELGAEGKDESDERRAV